MTTLLLGASGATGRLVVQQLLAKGEKVNIIVRKSAQLSAIFPEHILLNSSLSITQANFLSMSDDEVKKQVEGCNAVVSCLGHNISFKGIYGQPRQLVTQAMQRVCEAINAQSSGVNNAKVKIILMGSTGVKNNDSQSPKEITSLAQRAVIKALRALVPPHADNEKAAWYLQSYAKTEQITDEQPVQQPNQQTIEWVVVRPDSLIDEAHVSPYSLHAAPTRSAIFNAGQTSRINVAHFISELVVNTSLWQTWLKKMPVIYNQ